MKKKKNSFTMFILLIVLGLGIFVQSYGADEIVKKKILFVKDDDGEAFTGFANYIGSLLPGKGWTKDNSEYIVLSMEGQENKAQEVISKILEIKPDVVLVNNTLIKPIGFKLKDANIPCVAGGGLEMEDEQGSLLFVDKNGNPTANITGTYTMPRTHIENTFKLLNKITPIKNKKVVFATYNSAAFTKKNVETSLKRTGLKLKEFKEFKYVEQYQEFVKKYNNDNEVGWIMLGEPLTKRKDGQPFSLEEIWKWDRDNNKKPNTTYWETGVQNGMLCALAIDSITTVGQMVTMGDRILKGEKVSQVKPEDPARTLIILNQARAKDLKIEFPIDILQSAWKIYTDYEGHSIEKK